MTGMECPWFARIIEWSSLNVKYDEEEVLKIVAENERAMEKKRNVKFIIPVNAPYVLKSRNKSYNINIIVI